jgi:biopolymer transport protein ExbD
MDEKEFDYMNVIPLVDVMLVLLTIVLTTSTFIATGSMSMELPKASKSSTGTLKTQIIEIDKTGNIYLNSSITTLGGLENSLKSIDTGVPILIRADKSIVLQFFVDVMDTLKSLGFKKLSLQTEEK